MASASWTDGRFILSVDLDTQKTTITRVSDGTQVNFRNSTVAELQQAQAIVSGSESTIVTTLREDMIAAYQGLRAVNQDRAVTWAELRDAVPPALEVLRRFRNLGTQDLLTVRYAFVLVGEVVESVIWAMKDERDKFALVTSEVLSLRQELNALTTRVTNLETP